jgi:hypothetical protein
MMEHKTAVIGVILLISSILLHLLYPISVVPITLGLFVLSIVFIVGDFLGDTSNFGDKL